MWVARNKTYASLHSHLRRHRQDEDNPGAAERVGVRGVGGQPAAAARSGGRRRCSCIFISGGGSAPNQAGPHGARLALARPQRPRPQVALDPAL